MKYKILLSALLYGITAAGQPTHEWATQTGASSTDYGESITVDESGNIYTAGVFTDTVDFDPGPGVSNLIADGSGTFVCKKGAAGNLVWARHIPGSGNNVVDVEVDENGVYVLGHSVFFLTKFDLSGNLIWIINLNAGGASLVIDSQGDLLITGGFNGTVDFDPGAGVSNLTAHGDGDAFVLKLNSAGNLLWVKQIGGADNVWGSSSDAASSITLDENENIIVGGHFYVTVDFDPGPGTFNLTSQDFADFFILKLSPLGDFIWAKQIGGPSYQYRPEVAADANNNIFITTSFGGTIDFDPGPGTYNLTAAGYSSDIFVCKLNHNGNFIWAKSIGGPGWDESYSISVDNWGNVYTTGSFQNSANFNPGSGTYHLTSAGYKDIFISELDANGDFVCAGRLGGPGDDIGNAINVDNNANIYVTGAFGATADFNPGSGIYNLTSSGHWDFFTATYKSCMLSVGQEETTFDPDLSVHPNPGSGIFQVNYNSGQEHMLQLNVRDLHGRTVYSEKLKGSFQKDIDLAKHARGIYFIEVIRENNKQVKRVILK